MREDTSFEKSEAGLAGPLPSYFNHTKQILLQSPPARRTGAPLPPHHPPPYPPSIHPSTSLRHLFPFLLLQHFSSHDFLAETLAGDDHATPASSYTHTRTHMKEATHTHPSRHTHSIETRRNCSEITKIDHFRGSDKICASPVNSQRASSIVSYLVREAGGKNLYSDWTLLPPRPAHSPPRQIQLSRRPPHRPCLPPSSSYYSYSYSSPHAPPTSPPSTHRHPSLLLPPSPLPPDTLQISLSLALLSFFSLFFFVCAFSLSPRVRWRCLVEKGAGVEA